MHASGWLSVVYLERVDVEKNAYRYYVLPIEPRLFEEMNLVREWGRIGQGGRRIIELWPDAARAKVDLGTWLARKRRRGYEARG